jgi:hypothetical protein
MSACRVLVGKPIRKRHRRTWQDNIKMDLTDIRWCGVDWIDLLQDRDQRWPLRGYIRCCDIFKLPSD